MRFSTIIKKMSHEAFHGFIDVLKSERMFKKFSVSILLIMGPVLVQHINKTVELFHVDDLLFYVCRNQSV